MVIVMMQGYSAKDKLVISPEHYVLFFDSCYDQPAMRC